MLTPRPPFSKGNRSLLLPEDHEYINPETIDCVNILSDQGTIKNLSGIDLSFDTSDIGKIYNTEFIKTPLIYADDIQTVTLEASDTITSVDIQTVTLEASKKITSVDIQTVTLEASEKITSVDIQTGTLMVDDTLISNNIKTAFLSAFDISTTTFKSIISSQLSNINVMGNILKATDPDGNIEIYPSTVFEKPETESKGIIVLNQIDLDKSTFTSRFPVPVPATETEPAIVSSFTFTNPVNILFAEEETYPGLTVNNLTVSDGVEKYAGHDNPVTQIKTTKDNLLLTANDIVHGSIILQPNVNTRGDVNIGGEARILNNKSLAFEGGVNLIIGNNQSNKNLFSYSWPAPTFFVAPVPGIPLDPVYYLGVKDEGDSTIIWDYFIGGEDPKAFIPEGYTIGPYLSFDFISPTKLIFQKTNVKSCWKYPLLEPYTTTVGPFLTDTLGDKSNLQWYIAEVTNFGCNPELGSCSPPIVSLEKLDTPAPVIKDGKIEVDGKEYTIIDSKDPS